MSGSLDALKAKHKLNAESESYLQQRLEETGKHSLSDLLNTSASVVEARQASDELLLKYAGDAEFEGDVKEFLVPSRTAPGGVPVDMIKPLEVNRRPAVIIYFHDGDMVFGSRKTDSTICKTLAKYTAWAGNDSKVGVAGAGAGGNIAAALTHEVPGLSFQTCGGDTFIFLFHSEWSLASISATEVLVYPILDFRFGQASFEDFLLASLMSQEQLSWCTEQFLNTSQEVMNVRASPLLQTNFSKLPPALILVAELDPLKDACYEYKRKMKEAGVEAESLTLKGTIHGFFSQPGHFQETSRRALDKILSFLKKNGTS